MSYDEMTDEELWEQTQSEDLDGRAYSLRELGQRKIAEENFPMAKTLYGSAADVFSKLERELELAGCIYSVGYCHFRLGEHADAVATLADALARSEQLADSRSISAAARRLAVCYTLLGEDDKAIPKHELALEACLEVDDSFNAALNCLELGEIHGRNARQTKALESFIRAFNIFQSSGDAFGAARARDRMASALIELGNLDQAIMHIRDALLTSEHMENPERVAFFQYRLGWTLVLNKKYYPAISHLRSSAQFYRAGQDWSNAAVVEIQLANALRLMDPETPNQESETILLRLAAYFESAGDATNALTVESIKGEKLLEAGAFDAAAEVFAGIVSIADDLEDAPLGRQARASQAEALFKAGRMTEAKEVFAEIDASLWGENDVELERIEKLKKLMLDTMALTLNIGI